jgi:hypothetical protein
MSDNTQEQLDKVEAKMKEQLEEQALLKYTLALEGLLPGIFEHGGIKILFSSVHPHKWPHDWKMLVTMGNGIKVQVDLQERMIFGEENKWIDLLKPEGAFVNPLYLNGKVIERPRRMSDGMVC